jgi:hypothetical protein
MQAPVVAGIFQQMITQQQLNSTRPVFLAGILHFFYANPWDNHPRKGEELNAIVRHGRTERRGEPASSLSLARFEFAI